MAAKRMKIEFVGLAEKDLHLIKEIYDYYIEHSTATYYTEKISLNELKEFIPVNKEKYKSYLVRTGDQTCGFCCFAQYKKRQAYDRTAEVSVYLKPGFTGKGIGNEVLAYLENMARNAGISVLIGIISGDNSASIKLFEKNGYEKCGHIKQIGEKFNKILDVVYYQKIL